MAYRVPLRLDDEVSATLSVSRRTERSLIFHCAFGLDSSAATAVEVWLTKVHVRFGPDGTEAVPLAGPLLAALDAAAAGEPGSFSIKV
jgi:acyl-CoA thioesterase FadM